MKITNKDVAQKILDAKKGTKFYEELADTAIELLQRNIISQDWYTRTDDEAIQHVKSNTDKILANLNERLEINNVEFYNLITKINHISKPLSNSTYYNFLKKFANFSNNQDFIQFVNALSKGE